MLERPERGAVPGAQPEDEPGDALFVLARGKVKVVLYGESGREVILSIFSRPGDGFGEMSLLDDAPRPATVAAMEPSTLLVLSPADFRGRAPAVRCRFWYIA